MRNVWVLGWMLWIASIDGLAESARIIGGTPPLSYSDGSQVVIVASSNGKVEQSCSGVLVGPQVVLTSAFCAVDSSHRSRVWFLDEWIEGKPILHPKYPNVDIDLALVVLEKPIRSVTPVSIANKLQSQQQAAIYGFGCQSESQPTYAPRLNRADIVVDSVLEYDWIFKTYLKTGMCFGDLGSPAIRKSPSGPEVIGVGSKVSADKLWNFYTRVDTQDALRFFGSVAEMFDLEVCGINAQCGHPYEP